MAEVTQGFSFYLMEEDVVLTPIVVDRKQLFRRNLKNDYINYSNRYGGA